MLCQIGQPVLSHPWTAGDRESWKRASGDPGKARSNFGPSPSGGFCRGLGRWWGGRCDSDPKATDARRR